MEQTPTVERGALGPFETGTTPPQRWQYQKMLRDVGNGIVYNGGYVNDKYVGTPKQYQSTPYQGGDTLYAESASACAILVAIRRSLPVHKITCPINGVMATEYVWEDFSKFWDSNVAFEPADSPAVYWVNFNQIRRGDTLKALLQEAKAAGQSKTVLYDPLDASPDPFHNINTFAPE